MNANDTVTETITTDVVIVGASVAGTTAATLFARQGLNVLLVDRVEDPAAYKRMCTHFVQAVATPVLEKLGVVDELLEAGAVKNGFHIWTTAGGWFQATLDGERDADGRRQHGFTLRRKKLDPILRANAARTPGVTLRLGLAAEALVRDDNGRVVGVDLFGADGRVRVMAKLVVGADGRRSKVAELSEIETEVRPHNRGGFLAYFENVRMKAASNAQFWILGDDVAYAFPSDDGLVCLAAVVHPSKHAAFNADREGFMRRLYAQLPDGPDLSQATVFDGAAGFVGVQNTPNTYRYPTIPGLALVGDAAMASDYIWGVGCAWALLGGDMLVTHAAQALKNGAAADVDAALDAYAQQHKRELYTQHVENTAFSASPTLPKLQGALFANAPHDAKLQHLLQLSAAGKIARRDLRVPLRLLVVMARRKLASLFAVDGVPASRPAAQH